ncbi:MAG: PDZ domain-containing protein [Luteitalea sp.]|nr:PDZ domain-containing protein [Luteitalea sp.]
MEPTSPYRPRVSRETRLLLTAGVLAIAALWLLARFRFRDLPVTPNPIPAVLSQLATGPRYDDLAAEIAPLQARLEASLLALEPRSVVFGSQQTSRRIAALRFRDDVAVTLLPTGSIFEEANLLASDAASGLAVVRVPSQAPSSTPAPWIPRRLQQPRYLIATDLSPNGVSLRPVFVGSLDQIDSPLWSEPLWTVPERSDLAPGSFLFTSNAELVGMVIEDGVERVIVPGSTLLQQADRLVEEPREPAGTIGIEVQALTEPVASVTGASAGIVVTWVEQDGAAMGQLMAGDVIEAIDGRTLATRQHWDVRVARLSVGETLPLRVRRRGEVLDVMLVATSAAVQAPTRALGLTLRGRTGIGAEVTRVEPASAGDRAGLAVGDVITLVAAVRAPTPAQVARSFTSVPQGQRVMIAVTRGDAHHVTTLER